MIISPISAVLSNLALIKAKIDNAEDPRQGFHDIIEGEEGFTYLIDWVYRHQMNPETYDRNVIREKYRELIDLIFNMNADNIIKK